MAYKPQHWIGHKQKSRVLYLHYAQLLITTIITVNLCMLDISKAFDKVNHYCMFIKLMNRSVPVVLLLTGMINVLCLFVGIIYYQDVFI